MSWLTNCHVDKTMAMIENLKIRGEDVYAAHAEIMLNCIKYYEEKMAADNNVIIEARKYIEQLKATISIMGDRVSLRDEFAKAAMQVLWQREFGPDGEYKHICEQSLLSNSIKAFEIADAMIKERMKHGR